MAVVMVAAAILAGTVLYTIFVLRTVQMRILTGEMAVTTQIEPDWWEVACVLQATFVLFLYKNTQKTENIENNSCNMIKTIV